MELFKLYFEILKDPSIPANRVVRKTAVLTLVIVGMLIYYRHFILQLGFGEPVLVSIGLSFLVISIVGMFGGVLAGGFYGIFLKDVKAQNMSLTITTFFAECLFAIMSPLFGVIVSSFINFQ